MANRNLFQPRLDRILRAVSFEPVDRVPVVLEYSGFAAQVTGTSMAAFLAAPQKTLDTMIAAFRLTGAADAVNYGSFWPYALCYDFMARVRVPGIELGKDDLWQVVETELMRVEDYDRLLQMGWPAFFKDFMQNRILGDVPAQRLPPRWKPVDVRGAWADCGVPVLSGGDVTTPVELLCGARSLPCFFMDLFDRPQKVEAAMTEMVPHLAAKGVRRALKLGYPAVWVGGWRSAPCLLSPQMWDRFVWPHFKRLVNEVVASGLIAILHLDSDWTRELERFRELPARSCIMALDGETDIFKARQVLGDHMCLMGDVPASLLYLGTPGEIREYCTRLIEELGPRGFILQSGCDIPANAKLENVQAMLAAAGI
jgi:uroporphyrinogen-III decarboxylase